MENDILNIFKSAFDIEVANKVEIRDNRLLVYLHNDIVEIELKQMFKL